MISSVDRKASLSSFLTTNTCILWLIKFINFFKNKIKTKFIFIQSNLFSVPGTGTDPVVCKGFDHCFTPILVSW